MRESVTDTVLVSILAVNDAPEIIQIGDISIDEDAIATISLEGVMLMVIQFTLQ